MTDNDNSKAPKGRVTTKNKTNLLGHRICQYSYWIFKNNLLTSTNANLLK